MHHLAALLHALDVPVACTGLNFYNPLIPVRPNALPDDIVVYPDACRGNPCGAERICRYMLCHAERYFGGDIIAKEECAIVWHPQLLENIKAHCAHEINDLDVIMLPILDAAWCFPEKKTIAAAYYVGKGSRLEAETPAGAVAIPDPKELFNGHPYDSFYAHQRTLSILRRTEDFYCYDDFSIIALEAALCFCNVHLIAGKLFNPHRLLERANRCVMTPERDRFIARHFAGRVYKFFGIE
jgi:hypothetical protein